MVPYHPSIHFLSVPGDFWDRSSTLYLQLPRHITFKRKSQKTQKHIDIVFKMGYNSKNQTEEVTMKTQTTIRVEETSYHQAKEILSQMGLNYSQAISVFNNMIVLNKGLPFELKIPNEETRQALHELETRQGKSFKNVDALFEDLDA